MHIDHLAVWTHDLERLRTFYERHFGARSGARYASASRPGFVSYFLSFPSGGARLELMTLPTLGPTLPAPTAGYAHIALSVGSPAAVDALTERLRAAAVPVISEPRRTGDGYYEAVVEDPDGNAIEITG